AQQDPTRVVGFILIPDPGKRIENWALHGEFWQSIDARVLDAINQLPHKSQLDGILWHQGESNAGESDYHEKLYQLINRFREQTWYSWGKPFICGETVAYQLINSQLMALNANGDAWTGCVAGSDLTTQTDGYHFDAPALREIGRRYAAKYLAMTR
ncbi:MAG: sialate O-acetylesterase, partial [Pseudomonadota bacterium]